MLRLKISSLIVGALFASVAIAQLKPAPAIPAPPMSPQQRIQADEAEIKRLLVILGVDEAQAKKFMAAEQAARASYLQNHNLYLVKESEISRIKGRIAALRRDEKLQQSHLSCDLANASWNHSVKDRARALVDLSDAGHFEKVVAEDKKAIADFGADHPEIVAIIKAAMAKDEAQVVSKKKNADLLNAEANRFEAEAKAQSAKANALVANSCAIARPVAVPPPPPPPIKVQPKPVVAAGGPAPAPAYAPAASAPLVWTATSGPNIPANAVAAGKEANGQPLYLCRAKFGPDNGIHPGKTRREFNGCNIGWGGKEVAVPQYEVATAIAPNVTWVAATGANIPPNAVQGMPLAGAESAGPLAICRVNFQGGVHMGKTRKEFNACNFGYGGAEQKGAGYEILVVAAAGAPPAPATAAAKTPPGDQCAGVINGNAAAAGVCGPVCAQVGLKFAGNWSNAGTHPPVQACQKAGKGQSVCGCA